MLIRLKKRKIQKSILIRENITFEIAKFLGLRKTRDTLIYEYRGLLVAFEIFHK